MSSPTAISPPRASSLVSPSAAAVIAAGGGALALEESETVNANVIPGARPTSRQGQNARERKLTGGAAGAASTTTTARAPPSSFTLPPTFTPHPYNGPVNPDPLLVGVGRRGSSESMTSVSTNAYPPQQQQLTPQQLQQLALLQMQQQQILQMQQSSPAASVTSFNANTNAMPRPASNAFMAQSAIARQSFLSSSGSSAVDLAGAMGGRRMSFGEVRFFVWWLVFFF